MMKFVLILVIFLFSINIVLASDISQFVFTTDPQIISPNFSSEILTIETQSANGKPVNGNTICIQINSSSRSGELSTNAEKWSMEPIRTLNLTLGTNQYRRNFYYKDSATGSHTLFVKAALKPENKSSCPELLKGEWDANWSPKQDIVVSNTGAESSASMSGVDVSSQSQSPEPTYDVGSISWPTEPQIYANAGPDKTAVAGADVYFSGQALGLQKEPLENARYLWNFGDGAIAEGQNTKHVYKYPGEYIVVLDVSSGKYSVSDRLMAKIIPNQLEIIEANQNYIKLHNGSNVELDISFWFLRAENSLFKFPANTFIKTNRDLMIDSSISGLKAENKKAEILYPNSSVANSYFGYANGYAKAEKEKEPKSTTVVDSKKIEEIEELSTSTAQVANIISTTEPNSFGLKKWLMIILGISIFFAAGFIFIRRQGSL